MTRYSIVQFENGLGESWFQIKVHGWLWGYYLCNIHHNMGDIWKETIKFPLEKMARDRINQLIEEEKRNQIRKLKEVKV